MADDARHRVRSTDCGWFHLQISPAGWVVARSTSFGRDQPRRGGGGVGGFGRTRAELRMRAPSNGSESADSVGWFAFHRRRRLDGRRRSCRKEGSPASGPLGGVLREGLGRANRELISSGRWGAKSVSTVSNVAQPGPQQPLPPAS